MTPPGIDLLAERLNQGLSLPLAAEKIGVAERTLRRAEHGDNVHPANAKKIADFYRYKVTDIWPLPEPKAQAA